MNGALLPARRIIMQRSGKAYGTAGDELTCRPDGEHW